MPINGSLQPSIQPDLTPLLIQTPCLPDPIQVEGHMWFKKQLLAVASMYMQVVLAAVSSNLY